MSFPVTVCIPIILDAILENKSNRSRTVRIKNIRVACNVMVNYKVWLYLLDSESPLTPMLLSYDELSAGDYFIDDTLPDLPVGYKLMAQTDVPGKVFIMINAEEI